MLWIKKTKSSDYRESLKKKLKNNLFSYPKSDRNSYLIACPYKYEEDYMDYKKGLLIII